MIDHRDRDIIASSLIPDQDQRAVDALLALCKDRQVVLLGEATHGSHEFYARRAELTRRLFSEHGFEALALEGDWPDCYRINRFVRDRGPDRSGREALGDFRRFPLWMWRNQEVLELVEWMRRFNQEREPEERVGCYGLDLYSLFGSMAAVLDHFDRSDPVIAERIRDHYACLEPFSDEPQRYGHSLRTGLDEDCRQQVRRVLSEVVAHRQEALRRDGSVEIDEAFAAERNAHLVANAEEYYRQMYSGEVSTWNLRDTHMIETLAALRAHLRSTRRSAGKVIVWAHNSHIGDARSTSMGARGEWNLGQLAREYFGTDSCCLIGFTTYDGTVAAADDWGGEVKLKELRPALDGSYEALFHRSGSGSFVLPLRGSAAGQALNRPPLLERAVGVIYRPRSERASHYFHASLGRQFDAVWHIDRTQAVAPLDLPATWDRRLLPETYPSGL